MPTYVHAHGEVLMGLHEKSEVPKNRLQRLPLSVRIAGSPSNEHPQIPCFCARVLHPTMAQVPFPQAALSVEGLSCSIPIRGKPVRIALLPIRRARVRADTPRPCRPRWRSRLARYAHICSEKITALRRIFRPRLRPTRSRPCSGRRGRAKQSCWTPSPVATASTQSARSKAMFPCMGNHHWPP